MKRNIVVLFAIAGLVAISQASFANVYAAHLQSGTKSGSGIPLNYRLNEPADVGVTVTIKGPLPATTVVRTINAGTQTTGAQTVLWDGKDNSNADVAVGQYSWEVTASDDGYTTITKISDDANTAVQFYTPYGVAVDNDPASANFGRVYVVNGSAPTTPGTIREGDGVYILGNDLSDITGQGSAAYGGGVAWGTTASPFRCEVDPGTGDLFICDWSDPHSGVWIMDAAAPTSNFSELFRASIARDANGLRTDLHGSISDLVVEGSGASRTMYVVDEDLSLNGMTGGTGSIYKHPIGTTNSDYATSPSYAYDDAQRNVLANMNISFDRDPAGTGFWATQYRGVADSTGAPYLVHIVASTTGGHGSVDWISAVDGVGLYVSPANTTQGGIAVDAARNRVFQAGSAWLRVFDISGFPTVTNLYKCTSTTDGAAYSGTTSRDAAVDLVGNFYAVNSSAERLRVYSPGDGANSYTTVAPAPINFSTAAKDWNEYY